MSRADPSRGHLTSGRPGRRRVRVSSRGRRKLDRRGLQRPRRRRRREAEAGRSKGKGGARLGAPAMIDDVGLRRPPPTNQSSSNARDAAARCLRPGRRRCPRLEDTSGQPCGRRRITTTICSSSSSSSLLAAKMDDSWKCNRGASVCPPVCSPVRPFGQAADRRTDGRTEI